MKRIHLNVTSRIIVVIIQLMTMILISSCAENDTAQGTIGKQTENGMVTKVAIFESVAPSQSNTRTSLDISNSHGNKYRVIWKNDDWIWVKDNSGTFQKGVLDAFVNRNLAFARFALTTGTYSSGCRVNYTGDSPSGDKVTIKARQYSDGPNGSQYLGTNGDCGTAIATGSGSTYSFSLVHKSSYLRFLPRFEHEKLHHNIKLEKIVVSSSSGPIAGTYDFSEGSIGAVPIDNPSNSITLQLGTSPVPMKTDKDTCYYMVIAPSSTPRTLKVEYFIHDPQTRTKCTVTKTVTVDCAEGKMHDITAKLDNNIREYDFREYYLWDAKKRFWYGHEWDNQNIAEAERWQPVVYNEHEEENKKLWETASADIGFHGTAAPTRFLTTPFEKAFLLADYSCKNCPNANEIAWYVRKGDAHWDDETYWTTMGHLYNGGIWLKKISVIAAEEPKYTREDMISQRPKYPDEPRPGQTNYNFDLRRYYMGFETEQPTTLGNPHSDDYFFLPALGYYQFITTEEIDYKAHLCYLYGLGQIGFYWGSNVVHKAYPAYYGLEFNKNKVALRIGSKNVWTPDWPDKYYGFNRVGRLWECQ